jgi:ribosomal subunit interface protein
MQLPLQITFRDMPHSDAVEQHVRRRAAKLDQFFERITACRVVVEVPHRRHHHGKRYHVRIDLAVPRNELVVRRNPADNLRHEDMHAAIDDAFDDAERLLEDYARRLRRRA